MKKRLEYRIVPREWGYGSKVRVYQTLEQFKQQSQRFTEDKFRYEVREVTGWLPIDQYFELDTNDGVAQR